MYRHHQPTSHHNHTYSRPSRVTPWPRNPQPCDVPRSECPNHARNYRAMLRSLERRGVEGPEELEYIYSRTRGPDPGADWCRHSLEEIGVWRGLLVHFGALRGPAGLRRESGRGAEGGRGRAGRGGRGRAEGGRAGAGHGGHAVGGERAEVASWGGVSRPGTRAEVASWGGVSRPDARAEVASWGGVSRPGTRAPTERGG